MHYADASMPQYYSSYETATAPTSHVGPSAYLAESNQQCHYYAPNANSYNAPNSSKFWYNNCCLKETTSYNVGCSYYGSCSSESYGPDARFADYNKPIQIALNETTEAARAGSKRQLGVAAKLAFPSPPESRPDVAKKHRADEPTASACEAAASYASSSLQFSPSSSSVNSTSPSSSSAPTTLNDDEFVFESLYKAYISGSLTKGRYKRLIANERERKRMHGLNSAFENLRVVLPSLGSNKQFSKYETLKMAKSYIAALRELLSKETDASATYQPAVKQESEHWTGSSPQLLHQQQQQQQQQLPCVKIIKIDSLDYM